jgi:hypothetical protein
LRSFQDEGITRALVALVLAGGLAVIFVTATQTSHGFHSATRVYSVQQVEAAFSAHGIKLRKANKQLPKVVVLGGRVGRAYGYVNVYVAATVHLANPFRIVPWLAESRGPIRGGRHGNVVLIFKNPTPSAPITAALADLH